MSQVIVQLEHQIKEAEELKRHYESQQSSRPGYSLALGSISQRIHELGAELRQEKLLRQKEILKLEIDEKSEKK